MKYCRFMLDGQTHYGAIEDRDGELWIVDVMPAPEEDLAFRQEHGRSTSLALGFEPMPLGGPNFFRPSLPRRSSAWAATIASTPRSWETKFLPSR